MADVTQPTKKAWQRPENWFTYGGLAALGVLGVMFLDKLLPTLVRVLELALTSIWYGAGIVASLAFLTWLFTSKDLHKLLWYGYKAVMRWVTRRFVEIDPIAILHIYVDSLKKNLEVIKASLADLRGQARKLENRIKETVSRLEHSMQMAAQAKARADQTGMKREFVLQARKAGRLESSNVTYQGLLSRIKAHIAVTEKIKEAAEFMIVDIEDTVEVETQKREMIHASHKAMSASRRILAANEQRELYDMAMESITNDYYAKLGEIEQFMEDSQHFINTMDLENGVFEADALAKLEAWEKRSADLFEGGSGKTKYRVETPPEHNFAEEDREIEEKLNRGSYADLFSKLD